MKKSILIVEDDEICKKFTMSCLKEFYELDSARNGLQAIELASQKNYDAILMDINLGKGINGIETTCEIRKFNDYKSTPVIAVTAYVGENEKNNFFKNGCSHYLSKPFNKTELNSLLSEILNQKPR